MRKYLVALFIGAGIVGSAIGHSERDKIRLENIVIRNLPTEIQSKVTEPFSAASGAVTGVSLMYVALEPYLRKKRYENAN